MLKIIYRRMCNLTDPGKSLEFTSIQNFFEKAGLFYMSERVKLINNNSVFFGHTKLINIFKAVS